MQTGHLTNQPVEVYQAMPSTFMVAWYPGLPSHNVQSHCLLLRQSIWPSHMPLKTAFGYVFSLLSSVFLCHLPSLFLATTRAPSTLRTRKPFTHGPNILMFAITSLNNSSRLEPSRHPEFLHSTWLPTSSRNLYHLFYTRNTIRLLVLYIYLNLSLYSLFLFLYSFAPICSPL